MGESLNSHRISSDLSTLKIPPGYSVSHSAGYLIIIYWHFGQNFNFHILLNITSKNNKQQKQQLRCLEMLLCSPHGFSVLIHISLFNFSQQAFELNMHFTNIFKTDALNPSRVLSNSL